MSMLSEAVRDDVHHLWDELSDFDVGHTDEARRHLQTRLCAMVGAWNSTWGGAFRIEPCPEHDDPLRGWRVAITQLLHPFKAPDSDGPFKALQERWNRREGMDPSFLLPMRNVGEFRTYGHRRDMPPEWFDDLAYRLFCEPYGTVDSLWVGFPINSDAESHFGFYSHRVFSGQDIALLAYALRGIKWFHRQLMLTSGPLVAKHPLTPTERRVLKLLLTKASEKVMSEQLGLAASTTHQHVVSLFRKFAVRSRAELMSLWLTRPY